MVEVNLLLSHLKFVQTSASFLFPMTVTAATTFCEILEFPSH